MIDGRTPDKNGQVIDPGVDGKGKGKGKAVDAVLPNTTDEEDVEVKKRLKSVQAARWKPKSTRLCDRAWDVKIFAVELLSGRL